ncbi:hypothetical protein PG997_001497 [Apiospora hydei]|uniref:Fungal N-terminal domain-containing protein n=1 Tax=Apiospora hydei TaxID=1337664 RepID=A0ABR1XDQ4_9PEZI
MDPLTITTSVITLAEAASKIYKFLQSIRQGDTGYSGLCAELGILTSHIQAIREALQNCRKNRFALAPIDEDVWKQSDIAIADCQRTILFRRAKVAAEMQIHARTIVGLRDKIHMSTISLQTLLQVINTSISLRSGANQQETLRELQKLKKSLETSTLAATNSHSLAFMTKSDAYILKNLQGLVKAAKGFHAAASTAASTVYAKSSHGGIPEAHDSSYAESGVMSPTTSEIVLAYAGFIQMLRRRRVPPVQDGLGPRFDEAPELFVPSDPELVDRCRNVANYTNRTEDSFDSTFSLGLEKMTQRALEVVDFERAEAILAQAISWHKVRDADDAHHSQLRIQHALCCFIQGKGIQNAEVIEDIAESRGTDRSVSKALIYALALCQIHELEHDATQRLCKLLWENIDDDTHDPRKEDVLRLLLVTYRLSGQPLLAEAIEEGHPGLSSEVALPKPMEFIVQNEGLLRALFRTETISQAQQTVVDIIRYRSRTAETTCLEHHQTSEQFSDTCSTLQDTASESPSLNESASPERPKMRLFRWSKHDTSLSSSRSLAGSMQAEPRTPTSVHSFDRSSQDGYSPLSFASDGLSVTSPSLATFCPVRLGTGSEVIEQQVEVFELDAVETSGRWHSTETTRPASNRIRRAQLDMSSASAASTWSELGTLVLRLSELIPPCGAYYFVQRTTTTNVSPVPRRPPIRLRLDTTSDSVVPSLSKPILLYSHSTRSRDRQAQPEVEHGERTEPQVPEKDRFRMTVRRILDEGGNPTSLTP